MERTEQHPKRRWRIWQYRSLILGSLCCLFLFQTSTSKSESFYKKNTLYSKAQLKNKGYKISHIKKGDLFWKLKLKKGDIIKAIDGKSLNTKKKLSKTLSRFPKRKKEFSILLYRNKKHFLLSYKIKTTKKTRIFLLSDVLKITKKRANERKKNPQKPITKKSLFPKKYKDHLQKAYVISLNSFIYKQAHFDAVKLHSFTIGGKILISKRIFRPPHNFGSFYKVFLFHPKKIVGYISEAEVVPEFSKQNGIYQPNPHYKIATNQLKNHKTLDASLFKQTEKAQIKNKKTKKGNNKKRYAGLSVGSTLITQKNFFIDLEKQFFIGLKISGYDLLISSLNMDFNLTISPYDFKFFHLDTLIAYPLLKMNNYFFYLLGGAYFDFNRRILDLRKQNDPGLSGGLSFIIPLNQRFLFRMDLRGKYGFSSRFFHPDFLTSLQIAF